MPPIFRGAVLFAAYWLIGTALPLRTQQYRPRGLREDVAPADRAAIYEAVLDSAKSLAGLVWRRARPDEQVTLVLDPLIRRFDHIDALSRHPTEWLDRQLAREEVVALCEFVERTQRCDNGVARMAVSLSGIYAGPEDTILVELVLSRRTGGPPGGRGGFGAAWLIRLRREGAGWIIADVLLYRMT